MVGYNAGTTNPTLLDRLCDRRRQEWSAQNTRELEELAGDAFLAQWNRRTRE